MRFLLLFTMLFAASFLARAQTIDKTNPANACGTDQVMQRRTQTDSSFRERVQKSLNFFAKAAPDTSTVYTLPVVFVMYHRGEPVGTYPNVPDADIMDGLNRLNQLYRAERPTYDGPNIRIQFALAKRTPTCPSRPTTGIVRVDARSVPGYGTTGTLTSDPAMEAALRQLVPDFSRQEAEGVIVIRVVKDISFTGGYAYFGGDTFVEDYFVRAPKLLGHELAHILYLYHPFTGSIETSPGSGSYSCPVNNNPAVDGDAVADTDPQREGAALSCNEATVETAINNCTGRPFGKALLRNHMNYSTCASTLFTPGQRDRMRISLTSLMPTLLDPSYFSPPTPGEVLTTPVCSISLGSQPSDYYTIGIERVVFNTIDRRSGLLLAGPFYTDNSCLHKTTVSTGETYELRVHANTNPWKAYIDYNNDGAFNETTELVAYQKDAPSVSITIPPIPPVLNTYLRMRIVTSQAAQLSLNGAALTACFLPGDAFGVGEAEDYAVQIVTAPVVRRTRYVRPDEGGEGTSWSNASGDLQAIINASGTGDTVRIATGVFRPTRDRWDNEYPSNPRTRLFQLKTGVTVLGGYAGTGTNPNLRTPGSTTLSGDFGVVGDDSDNALIVVYAVASDPRTRLDGFVITEGNYNQNYVVVGGSGMLIHGANQGNTNRITVANCTFINNKAPRGNGGGLRIDGRESGNASPRVLNCSILNNSAQWGGGVDVSAFRGTARPTFIQCQLLGNTALDYGGGLNSMATPSTVQPILASAALAEVSLTNCTISGNRVTSSFGRGGGLAVTGQDQLSLTGSHSLTITNCVVNSNTATNGGGIMADGGFGQNHLTIQNSLIAQNVATGEGGGLNGAGFNGDLRVRLFNCTIARNSALNALGGVSLFSNQTASVATLTNCIVWDNTAPGLPNLAAFMSNTITYSDIQGGGYPGTGNLDTDPLFVNPSAGDFSLSATSPARDTGDPATTTALAGLSDLAGNPRIAGSRIDMGAYEFLMPVCAMITVQPGNWNDAATWSCGRVPTATDAVRIRHAVTLPVAYQGNALRVSYDAGQRLVFGAGARLQLAIP